MFGQIHREEAKTNISMRKDDQRIRPFRQVGSRLLNSVTLKREQVETWAGVVGVGYGLGDFLRIERGIPHGQGQWSFPLRDRG